ncbi:23S rRNA (pseudouridine1915-N3)-methyltransferase [Caldanaerobius fijiensis DSM 17918]|uniref:Ribosomal RNA large subunit methyltransferase H n=1 Tax=Caldanaerobius fijiensis DSM 17918 TaxID=1121256 RepID=A0A1M4X8L0_9THEO|nr:23S rRNA (pseudouridine(1915)-N(3))-methyltransferase RlmH [Caldanaerobius fijiensis]SHE89829.1 23S rRNA (pseudouridine1915-N3)-methyltransferase [Caldanaerobius fijiensis DSM 17918]
MGIDIIAVGKIKEKYIQEGVSEYAKRLSRYCKLNIVEVPDEKAPENLSDAQKEQVKQLEGERIRAKIKKGSFVIVTDINGEQMSSERLASKLNELILSGKNDITIVIGGSLGLCDELVKNADMRLSFSKLTFPHQLFRLILLEQLYRCFKIIHAEPYHK